MNMFSSFFSFCFSIIGLRDSNLLFDLWYIESIENGSEYQETITSTVVTDTNTNTSQKISTTEQLVLLTTSALALPPPSPTIPRDLWTNKIEFLLSVIGYVVDLGKKIRLIDFIYILLIR
jgi:hypothetical protein